jgi:S1-C subfamily serine protease
VVVREVEPGKPAKLKGLQEYSDFITEVNGTPVNSPAEFLNVALPVARAGQSIRLTLGNKDRTVTLP